MVEISNGKGVSVPAMQVKGRKRTAVSAQKTNFIPASLNLVQRKRETERIERENHAFAKRLFDKQAILSKKALDDEFRRNQHYKE